MLIEALKIVLKRDTDVFRLKVYEDYKKRHFFVRLIEGFYTHSPPSIKSLMLFAYGLKAWLDAPSLESSENLGLFLYPNEKKQLDFIGTLLSPHPFSIKKVGTLHFSPVKIRGVLRILRLLRFIARRYPFLPAARMSSTVFYYVRFTHEFHRARIKHLFLSSEANPYAMGALWASKKFGIKSFYIPHGYISENPPALHFDVALFDGPAFKDIFQPKDLSRTHIIYKGCVGEYHPLKRDQLKGPLNVIGIFLSIISSVDELENIISDTLRRLKPKKILLRLHPNLELRDALITQLGFKFPEVRISDHSLLRDDIAQCDLVFAGNSGVHLEILRQGVPSIQLDKLDALPHDTRKFIKNRVVIHFSTVADIDLHAVASFYGGDWSERYRYYDHYYGQHPEEIIKILRENLSLRFP